MKKRVRKVRDIIVSVIVPVRDEELHVERCIQSILSQDYPVKNLEVILVDGLSKDKTRDIIGRYAKDYPDTVRMIENLCKTVPYAMNIGIENSVGRYIIRLDAHSEYPNDYISKCVETLEKTDADNVGGLALTRGKGMVGEAFAQVLSSKFGVGNSAFRTNAVSGYVDTVPFGAFKRETFEKYGLYNEQLTRNQDYELNYRIRKNEGKIYLNSRINLTYYCRNTIKDILKYGYENGKWNLITARLCPNSMSIRHFVPLVFVLSMIIIPLLMSFMPVLKLVFMGELALYVLLDLVYSIRVAPKTCYIPLLLLLFPVFHVSYGFGSLIGLLR